jgi:hypothetical protein
VVVGPVELVVVNDGETIWLVSTVVLVGRNGKSSWPP